VTPRAARLVAEAVRAEALVLRARIVLACTECRPNAQVAQALGISRETVRKWRPRFAADRLEGLVDAPRSGAPRQITDEQVESLVARTLDQARPSGDSHWSTWSTAQAAAMSQSAVSRIWRAFGLKPGHGPPYSARAADGADRAGADDARLRPARYDQPARRPRHRFRLGYQKAGEHPRLGKLRYVVKQIHAPPRHFKRLHTMRTPPRTLRHPRFTHQLEIPKQM
jgi:transposase